MSHLQSLESIKQIYGSKRNLEKSDKPLYQAVGPDIDRGYAWVIVCAAFLGHVLIYGIVWTQGVFYMVFLEEFGETESKTAWIGTITTTCNYIGGPLGSIICNRYGKRLTICVGCGIASTGMMTSIFGGNIYHLYVTFAIAGFGLGISFVPIVTAVGEYFDRLRNIAMGLAVAGVGFGTFIYPPLIRALILRYDWRGALIVMSGVNMNLIVVAALIRPVLVMIPEIETDSGLQTATTSVNVEQTREESYKNNTRRHSSTKFSWQEVLQWDVLQNMDYCFFILNHALGFVGFSIVYMHIANFALILDFSFDQCAMILAAIGIANLVGRVMFGVLGQHPNLNVIGLYAVTYLSSGFITLLCPMLRYYAGLLTYAALFGFLTATSGVLTPEVLVTIVGLQRLSGGYGYVLLAQATGYLLGGPAGGWVYEAQGAYSGSFFLAGGCILLSGIFMIIPWNHSRQPWDLSKLEIDKNFHGYGVNETARPKDGESLV